jgi:glycosyltransferase involved in cell wall biosynthesis
MSLWLALASIPGRKIWYCHEPYRQLHLAATFPTIAARAATRTLTNTLAETAYEAWERRGSPAMDAVRTRDVEAVRTFDTVCVNSNYTRSMAQRAYGCRDYRVVYPLMHLPERGRPRSGLRRNDLRILVHSRLEAAKNIDTILRGFAQFSKFPGRRAYLHVVGEGTSRPKLERLADELELNARVTFHGFVPQGEIERIYDICEILALAPIDEPFGMVFPEAAVRGLLIVGPDHGGPFEIMDGGRLGFACDPFSPASVAQALQQIVDLTDREVDERRALAEESCRSRFSMETVGPQMLAAYGV